MSRFGALVRRELLEWRLLLLLAAIAGALPFLIAHLPQLERHAPQEVRSAVAIGLTALFGGAFVLLLGSTMIGRDLAERRLGFYLARPLGAWWLWLAKLFAAWLVVLVSSALVFLPTAVVDARHWFGDVASDIEGSKASLPILGTQGAEYFFSHAWAALPSKLSPAAGLVFAVVWLAIALVVVHGLSTALRSRSWVLLIDLSGLALTVLALAQAWWLLFEHQALAPMVWWVRGIALPLLLALVVAGGRQLSRGRGDLVRGHLVFSLTLWPFLLVMAFATLAWAHWVVHPELDDLLGPQVVEKAPDGPWLVVGGPTRGRQGSVSAFLVDSKRDKPRLLGGLDVTLHWLDFSADGRRLVWPRCHRMVPLRCSLQLLDKGRAEARDTGIMIESYSAALDLSDEGDLLVLAQNQRAELWDLGSGKLLASVRLGTSDVRSIQLVAADSGPQRIRVALGEDVEGPDAKYQSVLRQIDLATLDTLGTKLLPSLVTRSRFCRAGDAEHLLMDSLYPPRFLMTDAMSGEVHHSIEPPRPQQWRCLADGRVVLSRQEGKGDTQLTVLAADGIQLARHTAPGGGTLVLGPEVEPGILLVGSAGDERRLWKLSVDDGALESLGHSMVPLLSSSRRRSQGEITVGSPASRLVQSRDGSIWRLDPTNPEPLPVLGPFPGWPSHPHYQRLPRAVSGRG